MSSKLQSNSTLTEFFGRYFSASQKWKKSEPTIPLQELIHEIRPKHLTEHVTLKPLINLLSTNSVYLKEFRNYLSFLFEDRSFTEMILDVGIMSDDSFGKELKRKITDKNLPETSDPRKLRYIFIQIFYKKNDYQWVYSISRTELIDLLKLLDFKELEDSFEQESPLWQVYYSAMVISLRASGSALEKNIIRLTPQFQKKLSPFLALFREIEDLWAKSSAAQQLKAQEDDDYKQITVLLNQCREYLNQAYKGSETFGISLSTNKAIYRIQEQLDRIELILPLLAKEREEIPQVKLMNLFYVLMDIHSKRKKLGAFISDSSRLVAYEISSHKARTGEKYISEDKKGYFSMFKAALGGGFIVGILCVFKVLLGKIETSDFGHAFFYSMNYALGFIAIYLLGFTLATKQPAMTANTVAEIIHKGMNKNVRPKYRYQEFAGYFAQLFRTQFIAFVGNVLMAFPVALLGVYTIYMLTGRDIVETKYVELLKDLSPVHSLAIFHAAIAGVFLFLSGIISGNIANQNKFYNIYKRLEDNPTLKQTLGANRAKRLSGWYSKKWPGIMSNFWFGIFMGSTASIGAFLGLNLDIRHITFAAGNFGMGMFGANWHVAKETLFWSILGIGVIGFMNFIVSFGLSLILAFKSRNIPFREMHPVILSILHEFKTRPISFLLPYQLKEKEQTAVAKNNTHGKVSKTTSENSKN